MMFYCVFFVFFLLTFNKNRLIIFHICGGFGALKPAYFYRGVPAERPMLRKFGLERQRGASSNQEVMNEAYLACLRDGGCHIDGGNQSSK
jgi:hypothetical protein